MQGVSTPTGRVVLVTGAGDLVSGLAAGLVESLLARGARVALAGPGAEESRLALPPGAPPRVLSCAPGDITAPGRVVDTVVDRLGRLDHLVNLVAPRPRRIPLMELDPSALREDLHTGLVTPLAWVQRAYWRWMAAHGGSVVNVVAATGRGGPQDAALAGLTELTEWLAAELEPHVRVSTLVAGTAMGPDTYRAGAPGAVWDLLTRRGNRAHGPVFVLSEAPACPSMAA